MASSCSVVEIYTKVATKKVNHTAKEFTPGLVRIFTRVNGRMVLKTVTVFGVESLATRILDNG